MRKIFRWCCICFTIVAILCLSSVYSISCGSNSDDPVAILKKRIDKAEMIEYIDSINGAKLLYPDFFLVDTTGEYEDVRFYYSDKNVKELSLGLSYIGPRLYENTDKIVDSYKSDPRYKCLSNKKLACIMKGKDGPNSEYIYLIKYAKSRYWWIVYTLTYEPQYEPSVKRLIEMVKNLEPIPNEDVYI